MVTNAFIKLLRKTILFCRKHIFPGWTIWFTVPGGRLPCIAGDSLWEYMFYARSFEDLERSIFKKLSQNVRIVLDVGANVGLYSCYAAKAKHCRVFSFEPSVFNLEVLARNIYLNKLSDKISILSFPLSNSLAFNELKMSSFEFGGALSTFGEDYGQDGKPLNEIFSFNTIGISADTAVDKLKIPLPDYIKIDVDGIESLILQGGTYVLSKVKGVLIEINEDFEAQLLQSQSYLKSAGLVMISKTNADHESIISKNYNQIWVRI